MYEALYRKWRPKIFDDVISQETVTTTLKNQIISGHTAHAYMFTGPRGTGKTTCARILAKALNCLDPQNGNPCGKCEICRNYERLSDIVEIDAASNNGVDSIREIRDGLMYSPEKCKFRVYIIDEVHMLSPAAFNAFLKSIEEPPPYVKFIFATTEINKVPATILSRCQRFDFHRVKTSDITARIEYIASNEDFTITKEAADMIAVISDGGMRDALSLLDLCAAISNNIDEKTVSEGSGVADKKYIAELVKGIVSGDISLSLKTVNEVYENSMDIYNLSCELVDAFRNIMLVKLPVPQTEAVTCSKSELDSLSEAALSADLNEILLCLDYFQKTVSEVKKASNKRAEFEMRLIDFSISESNKISKDSKIENQIDDRFKALERKFTDFVKSNPGTQQNNKASSSFAPAVPPPEKVDFRSLKKADFKRFNAWNEVLDRLSANYPDIQGALSGSIAYSNKNVLLIIAKNPFFLTLFHKRENAEKLRSVIYDVTGISYNIRAKCDNNVDSAREIEHDPENSGVGANKKLNQFLENAKHDGIKTVITSDDNSD